MAGNSLTEGSLSKATQFLRGNRARFYCDAASGRRYERAMNYSGIQYEALDAEGRPVLREARIIGELPHEMRGQACAIAAERIGRLLGRAPRKSLLFGAPVYEAFGMSRPEAKMHPQVKLLLTLGVHLSLDYCR